MPKSGEIEVVAPNFNRRLSGVTATIVRLLPLQMSSIGIVTIGPTMPSWLPSISWWQLLTLGCSPPAAKPFRIWHARRNIEMLFGLFLKYLMMQRLGLVFTSASQRHHSAYSKWLIRRQDHVIATSKRTKSYLTVPATVIRHGIDGASFCPPEDREKAFCETGLPGKYAVGCFGRIRRQKGTDLFIAAMIELLPDHPDWSAVILGRATEQHLRFLAEQKQRIADAGLSDRIVFAGEVPVEEVAQWYQRLSLFIAPQRWEGFGLTPLEAMACAMPVVASDVGAFAELVVEGKTGFVVAADDAEAIAAAAGPLMGDAKLRETMAREARRHVLAHFTLEGEAAAINQVYHNLWQGAGEPS